MLTRLQKKAMLFGRGRTHYVTAIKPPSQAAGVARTGSTLNWISPTAVYTANAIEGYSTTVCAYTSSTTAAFSTNHLRCYGYNFSEIPASATIDLITVIMLAKKIVSVRAPNISLRIALGHTAPVTSDIDQTSLISASVVQKTANFANDFSVTDVKLSSFSVFVWAYRGADPNSGAVAIDQVTLSIKYSVPLF